MSDNPQLKLANEFVQFTDRNIFLTGKAGTGKTTFLHNLKKDCPKRMVIVAPTGVAAINAGGATIHSFFQLPFGPYIPDKNAQTTSFKQRMSRDKINLIRSIDLLVIDEISMVRADVLDSIDEVLRRHRDRYKPFGGVQLLMIGDLHQLSPVVKDEEWAMLQQYYPNPYFFSSRALLESQPISVELKHIYRQSDETFIQLLNSIRENNIDQYVLEQLNARYIPNFNPEEDEGYITLTSHNHTAKQINNSKLQELHAKPISFRATVEGEFPEFSYPNDEVLTLKEGAQVMFIKNDIGQDRRYYNGKIGKVTRVIDNVVFVKCPGEENEIPVTRVEWTNVKFELNTDTKEVEEKLLGSFIQYPLRTAWAITIHKSQGLTFEKAIIDAQAAFAHGQVYVALSRCKSYEGMVLRTPILYNSVKTDGTVAEYTRENERNRPDKGVLDQSRQRFQRNILIELIDFSELKRQLTTCYKLGEENDHVISRGYLEMIHTIRRHVETDIYTVSEKFCPQLERMIYQEQLIPEESPVIQERITSGCKYFLEKLKTGVTDVLAQLSFDSDNKAVKKKMTAALTELRKEVFVKTALLKSCLERFGTMTYIKVKANAEVDFDLLEKIEAAAQTGTETVSAGIKHPELYKTLNAWRNEQARQKGVPVYMVLPQKVLTLIVNQLPSTAAELESLKGMGKARVNTYGIALMDAIDEYCRRRDISRTPLQQLVQERKPEKTSTKEVSLQMFKSGKSMKEVAEERGLSETTVEGHLCSYIGKEIDIDELVTIDKIEEIENYIKTHKPQSMKDTKQALGEHISYGDIRAVMTAMNAE